MNRFRNMSITLLTGSILFTNIVNQMKKTNKKLDDSTVDPYVKTVYCLI